MPVPSHEAHQGRVNAYPFSVVLKTAGPRGFVGSNPTPAVQQRAGVATAAPSGLAAIDLGALGGTSCKSLGFKRRGASLELTAAAR